METNKTVHIKIPCPNCKRKILAKYDMSTFLLTGNCAMCGHRLNAYNSPMADDIREAMRAKGMAVPSTSDPQQSAPATASDKYGMKDNLGALALILIVAFLGGKGIYWVIHDTYYAVASQSWPTVTGRVVKTRLELSAGANHTTEYAAYVKYAYTVNNIPYVNDQIRFPQHRGAESTARKLLKKFPISANIPVYYDPDSPQHACLMQSDVDYFFIFIISFFSIILLLGSVLALLGLFGVKGPSKWILEKIKMIDKKTRNKNQFTLVD